MKTSLIKGLFLAISLWFIAPSQSANAQCPMCRISAESNLKNGGTAGKGLNKGILYLFFTPYLVIGTLGYLWWKNNKNKEAQEDQVPAE